MICFRCSWKQIWFIFRTGNSGRRRGQICWKKGAIFSHISVRKNRLGLDKFIDELVTEYIKRNPYLITNKSSIKLFEGNDDVNQLKAGCCAEKKEIK